MPDSYVPQTYGRFYWGSLPYYDYGSQNTTTTYVIQVDWYGDGLFTSGENEYLYLLPGGIEVERGREHLVKPQGDGFESMRPGKMTFYLLNNTGRYDPRNPNSPLYPNVKTGKMVKFWLVHTFPGYVTKYIYLFAGTITNITPTQKDGVDCVKVEALDGWTWLSKKTFSTGVMSNTRVDLIMSALLDGLDYPWGYDLNQGADVINYYYASNKKADAELNSLAEAELGFVFVAANGTLTYLNRWHNTLPSEEPIFDASKISSPPVVRQPWEAIKNKVRITVNPRVLRELQVLYDLGGAPLSLAVNSSITLWLSYKYNNQGVPALNVQTPARGVDLIANASQDGTGADLTGDLVITEFTPFGEAAKLTIANSGSQSIWVTKLQVKGYPVEALQPVTVESQTGEADLPFGVDLPWLQDINRGKDFADNILNLLSMDSLFPVIEFESIEVPWLDYINELGDIVNLNFGSASGNYRICKIRQILDRRRVWKTVLYLEPVLIMDTAIWRFTAKIGVDTYFYF